MIANTNEGASDPAMIHEESDIEMVMADTAIVFARTVNPMPLR